MTGKSRLVARIFRHEVINGRCATDRYLNRWTLLRLPGGRALYLHHFVGSDWSRDLHDHPKRFVSIGLRGGYVEERLEGIKPRNAPTVYLALLRRRYAAPWVRWFEPNHIHRLRVPPRGCWTLVYTGRTERDWGFWQSGRWVHWRHYVALFGGKGGC